MNTDLKNKTELEVRYGLPRKVKFCRKCCITNQRPDSKNELVHNKDTQNTTIDFSEDGICAACRNKEKQHQGVNWQEREKELMDLCDRFRRTDGEYDCIVPGSGGKDSVYASWMLKYKYNMHPLTITWAPHMYTDIGWQNFQRWIHDGGFDNYLFTPNGKTHRLLTRLATLNLLHPFQPFIIGQKIFVTKMCAQFNIPLAFYGEMPGEYGLTGSQEKKFGESENSGHSMKFTDGLDLSKIYLGGESAAEIIDKYNVDKSDLSPYIPADYNLIQEKKIEIHYLGYYLKWDPQECYYFAVDKTGFQANPVRTEGTYSKYVSLDDKIDGFNYYTGFIKFGMGRAMQDAAQEVRNKKIETDEAKALIKKFDGEFPQRYYSEFLEYVGLKDEEFKDLCDQF
ncbi:MAG: N-acetyl sugar amidotransferase, partial [Candidatus Omnitrophica bacterium]|nr:N-acetyl sugar amidotransferase [Candidatus Omnitrophota bacterium]